MSLQIRGQRAGIGKSEGKCECVKKKLGLSISILLFFIVVNLYTQKKHPGRTVNIKFFIGVAWGVAFLQKTAEI